MSKNMAVLNEQNEVINIIVCADDATETSTLIAYDSGNPAYIGGDFYNGYFYPAKPFPSWSRGTAGEWTAPIPYPDGELMYKWNEDQGEWIPSIFS